MRDRQRNGIHKFLPFSVIFDYKFHCGGKRFFGEGMKHECRTTTLDLVLLQHRISRYRGGDLTKVVNR